MQEPLFETKTKYTFEEFQKFNRVVGNKLYKTNLRKYILVALCVVIGVFFWITDNIGGTVIFFAYAVAIVVILSAKQKKSEKKLFESNKLMQDMDASLYFYEDSMEESSEVGKTRVAYDKLYRILETETNFYILFSRGQGFIIIKENCSSELISFVRNLNLKKK